MHSVKRRISRVRHNHQVWTRFHLGIPSNRILSHKSRRSSRSIQSDGASNSDSFRLAGSYAFADILASSLHSALKQFFDPLRTQA